MSERLSRREGENIHAVREEWQQCINWEGSMIDKCGKVQKRDNSTRLVGHMKSLQSRPSALVLHALAISSLLVVRLWPHSSPQPVQSLSSPSKLKIRVRSVVVIESCFG